MLRLICILFILLISYYLPANNDSLLIIPVEINSDYDDYAPVFIDSNLMIFTSSKPNFLNEKLLSGNHNMFICKIDSGVWKRPEMISYQTNSDNHETSAGISEDKKTLFVYKTFYGGDLYYSEVKGKSLTSPKKLMINTIYHESSACFSNGTLFFVSDRPEGKGGHDVYYCTQKENGRLSDPINLEILNSDQDENHLYISENGNTLYFSSKGHGSMGGYDIFKSTKSAEGNWSVPENIGSSVNSLYNEINFTADNSGKFYFSSDRPNDKYAGYNIFACTEKKIRVKVPLVLTGNSPIEETNIGKIEQIKQYVEIEGYRRDIPSKINIDINGIKDSTSLIQVRDLVIDNKNTVLDNPDDQIIKISILFKRIENLSLEDVKENIGFEAEYCKIQVGAFSTMGSIIDFAKRFPLLGDKVMMIRNQNFNRFLMMETFESIDSAAVLQQKCLKEYHSVSDTFIAVYDGTGKRVLIYFDMVKNSYILLRPEQQTTDDLF